MTPVTSVGFLGSGRLAECVARNLVQHVAPARKFCYKKQRLVSTLLAADPSEEHRMVFDRLGFTTTETGQDVLADCDLVFLGTGASEALARHANWRPNSSTLFVSLQGDLPAQKLEALCPGAKVMRMMPQTKAETQDLPSLPWATMRGSNVSEQDVEKVMRLAGISSCVEVEEATGLLNEFVNSMAEEAEVEHHDEVADFAETYEMGRELGVGAFSRVLEATHRETGEKVAVKCLANDEMTQEGSDLLIAEVAALNRLKHPHIISHHGFFSEDNKYLLVLDFCPHGSLRELLNKRQTLSEREAKRLLKQTLSALEYCHAMGQVHRDVKAENILLAEDEQGELVAKLADFGLSEELQLASNRLHDTCGTPQYLSPEIVSGRLYGTPSDIWSTGILAYMMLSGLVPFQEAKSDGELFKLISLGAVWYDQPEWQAVSAAARVFVQRMLDISPESRPSASELLQDAWLADA